MSTDRQKDIDKVIYLRNNLIKILTILKSRGEHGRLRVRSSSRRVRHEAVGTRRSGHKGRRGRVAGVGVLLLHSGRNECKYSQHTF